MKYALTVNGEPREVDVAPGTPLLWVLREQVGLKGTKYGCGVAQCGACTVHVDGKPARSCVLPVEEVGARAVTTIEGLSGPVADRLRAAWRSLDVPQCGYCQSGQLMTACALLTEVPKPDAEQVEHAMAGNVCRCCTYTRIRRAIGMAAEEGGAP
ncbi:MAG: (2Fe-2S)-binding protein [Deltaproteobacteria bacterium]|nr:(2Fe-2S)-binding protein [Deltaproteobacteria bacterium]